MSGILKAKQLKALWEIVALGQNNGIVPVTRAERKAAKWSSRVLREQGQMPDRVEIGAVERAKVEG